MIIVAWSCLCIRRFLLFGNQLCSAMDFLLDYTSENEFTQALLISGIISVGSISMSPIICSIRYVSISWFALTRCILYFPFCYVESHTNHNDVPYETPKTTVHLWFSSHVYFKKPRSKQPPYPQTNSDGIIPLSLSLSYNFK